MWLVKLGISDNVVVTAHKELMQINHHAVHAYNAIGHKLMYLIVTMTAASSSFVSVFLECAKILWFF